MAALLSLDDGMHCKQAQALAEHKLDSVRAKLADLRRIEVVLEGLVQQCVRSRGRVSCPLVVALHGLRPQAGHSQV